MTENSESLVSDHESTDPIVSMIVKKMYGSDEDDPAQENPDGLKGAVDTDGDPVPVAYYCNSRLTIDGESYGCGLHLESFKRPHADRHRGITAPPCGGCGGREEHRDNCPTPDATTNVGVWVWWNDDGETEFEAERSHQARSESTATPG
jgi:hypothetical protein